MQQVPLPVEQSMAPAQQTPVPVEAVQTPKQVVDGVKVVEGKGHDLRQPATPQHQVTNQDLAALGWLQPVAKQQQKQMEFPQPKATPQMVGQSPSFAQCAGGTQGAGEMLHSAGSSKPGWQAL